MKTVTLKKDPLKSGIFFLKILTFTSKKNYIMIINIGCQYEVHYFNRSFPSADIMLLCE
jgi:hypothetical protein